MERLGTKQGRSSPAPDEYFAFGHPQEIQDFMEAVAHDREPKCGPRIARGTVAVLYSAYLSSERRGQEVAAPLDLTVAE